MFEEVATLVRVRVEVEIRRLVLVDFIRNEFGESQTVSKQDKFVPGHLLDLVCRVAGFDLCPKCPPFDGVSEDDRGLAFVSNCL